MFTVEQIKAAHSKVKSGADFPRYVQDLINLGVMSYTTHVSDGHAEYFGADGVSVASEPNGDKLEISEKPDAERFAARLKIHQRGETDYPTFRRDSSETGIGHWTTDTTEMTCTYFDKAGLEILREVIPA